MENIPSPKLLRLLNEIPDCRKGNAIKHKLIDILTIGILAMLCYADTFTGMQEFGEIHKEELSQFLELPHGIPSHDVFRNVLSHLDADSTAKCFELWLTSLKAELSSQSSGARNDHVVAFDGKVIRKSGNEEHKAFDVITAYCSDLKLVLGQLCTEEKSNEITAIPQLLELLDLRGCTVTIDAIGTQRKIADMIIKKDADYILALKKNQSELLEIIEFGAKMELRETTEAELEAKNLYYATVEKDHGRLEERECWIFPELPDEEAREQWPGIYGAALIRTKRTTLKDGNSSETERWFIYSRKDLTAKQFLAMQRSHWAIENNLHWTLDVCFNEDDAHVRFGHAAVILNIIRKLCLQLLKSNTSKGSIKSKRLRCAWNFNYALSVLCNAEL